MINPETLTITLSRRSLRAPGLVLCLVGLLGSAACSGSIDDNSVPNPARTDTESTTSSERGTTGTARASDERDNELSTDEENSEDDSDSISGLEGRSGNSRGGGGGRTRSRDDDEDEDELLLDAGVLDAGLDDAGADVVLDAGIVDAGLVDAAAP